MVSEKFIAAIGNFDGVHLGHQHLLRKTAAFAEANNARPAVVCFEPHPRRFFRPEDPPFLLSTPLQRDALLQAHGAEKIFAIPFNKELASLAPDAFVAEILKEKLGLVGAITGVDFRFGAGRAGDGAALKELGHAHGLLVDLVDVLSENDDAEKFGSSAVRQALVDGDVEAAAKMLGRPWSVRGLVSEGQKLGRTLGFPTANLTLGDLIEPRNGVYAVTVSVDGDRKTYGGVANFGRRPTVGETSPLLEVHLFDFSGDLYGREIEASFVEFIRDEKKFDGLDALKSQIGADCDTARQILA